MSKQTEIRITITPEIAESISKMEIAGAQRVALKRTFGSCTSDREKIVKGALEDSAIRLRSAITELGILLVAGYADCKQKESAAPKPEPVTHFVTGDYLSIKQGGYTLQLRMSDAATFQAALEQHKARTEAEIAHHQRDLALINAVLDGKSTPDPEALR